MVSQSCFKSLIVFQYHWFPYTLMYFILCIQKHSEMGSEGFPRLPRELTVWKEQSLCCTGNSGNRFVLDLMTFKVSSNPGLEKQAQIHRTQNAFFTVFSLSNSLDSWMLSLALCKLFQVLWQHTAQVQLTGYVSVPLLRLMLTKSEVCQQS